jgi:hypothetical protein
VAWTVTHEEIFVEPRDYCKRCSQESKTLLKRKFFYLFTCEYCFSFYVTALFLIITKFHLLFSDWRGYLIAELTLVYVANFYMSFFLFIRSNIKKEKLANKMAEEQLNNNQEA